MIAGLNTLYDVLQWIFEPAGRELLKITESYKTYKSDFPDGREQLSVLSGAKPASRARNLLHTPENHLWRKDFWMIQLQKQDLAACKISLYGRHPRESRHRACGHYYSPAVSRKLYVGIHMDLKNNMMLCLWGKYLTGLSVPLPELLITCCACHWSKLQCNYDNKPMQARSRRPCREGAGAYSAPRSADITAQALAGWGHFARTGSPPPKPAFLPLRPTSCIAASAELTAPETSLQEHVAPGFLGACL